MQRHRPVISAPGWILTEAASGARALVHRAGRGIARVELWLPAGAGVPLHAHPGEERWLLAAGTLMLSTAGGMELLGPGAQVRLAGGEEHQWGVAGERRVHALVELRGAEAFDELVAAVWGSDGAAEGWTVSGRRPDVTDPSA